MNYIFLNLINERWYEVPIKLQTRNYPLEYLFTFLSDKEFRWIEKEEDKKNTQKIFIWSEWDLKKQRSFRDFETTKEFMDYCNKYTDYSSKRWEELPKIHIFKDNLEFLEQQWNSIYTRKPKYLIFRQHNNRYIDILEKDELSTEDIAIMEREHKIYLNYIKRWEAYLQAHPNRRTTWYSSEDDEYESDFPHYDPSDEQGVD